MRIMRLLIPVILVAMSLVSLAAASATTVSIEEASANKGSTQKVPINIHDVADLGAADMYLFYDKDVVTAEDVSDGNLGSITYFIGNEAGLTIMNWFSVNGKTGDFVFAYVTFKAVGNQGDISALNLNLSLVDSSGKPISHIVDSGIFTVSGALPTPAPTPTLSPTPSLTPTPTATPTFAPTHTPTPIPTPSPTSALTPTPTSTSSPAPSLTPTSAPMPTPTPSPSPSLTPTTIPDSDGDGWDDEHERRAGTNPYNADTDGDGIRDPEDPNPLVASTPTPMVPGFEAIFAIASLLIAVACLLRKKK